MLKLSIYIVTTVALLAGASAAYLSWYVDRARCKYLALLCGVTGIPDDEEFKRSYPQVQYRCIAMGTTLGAILVDAILIALYY